MTIAIGAVPGTRHTASCRNTALLVLKIWLCILALIRVIAHGRLALALVGGRGLLLVVLRHVDDV